MRKNKLSEGKTIIINRNEFKISGMAGEGSTCVVYKAKDPHFKDNDNYFCIIKELYPEEYEFTRNPETNCIDNYDIASSEFERFEVVVDTMKKIYCSDPNNTNYIDSCSGGGYLVMQWFNGETFENYTPKSPSDLLKRIKSIAERLEIYHRNNYLHLDIKPENIFCLDGSERVNIIDFDSVIKKDDAQKEDVIIRCSSDWAAPELITGKREQICAATDVYAVGEMLYYKLTGEHSDILERTMHGNHSQIQDLELLRGMNPKLLEMLLEFFRKTLCSAPSARYNDEELIEALDKMIPLSDPPYIITNLEEPPSFFVGREELFDHIRNNLNEKDYLFIEGMGGIGKTALALKYASDEFEQYSVICHTKSNNPIKEIELGNYTSDELDSPEAKSKKFNAICKACKDVHEKNVLMIFDNVECFDNDTIELLLNKKLCCKKVFLTRRNDSNECDRNFITLEKLSDTEAIELFKKNLERDGNTPFSDEENTDIKTIVTFFESHTLFVQLAARVVNACGDIKRVIEALKKGKTKAVKFDVRGGKPDDKLTLNEHLKLLFDITELNKDELTVFARLGLLPVQGVAKKALTNILDIDPINIINKLVDKGWVQDVKIDEKRIISLHPLIAELAEEILYDEPHLCNDFLNELSDRAQTNPRDLDEVSMILFVAAKLIDTPRRIETVEVADFLTNAAGMRGARICSDGGFAQAISIYLANGNNEKALNTANKWCTFHTRLLVDEDFLKCLDEMLTKIKPDERSIPIFKKMFTRVFEYFGDKQDEKEFCNWCHKFNKLYSENERIHAEDFARKVATERWRNMYYENPKLNGRSLDEQIEIADKEQDAKEKARLYLHIAFNSLYCTKWYDDDKTFGIKPKYEIILECFEKIRSVLNSLIDYMGDCKIDYKKIFVLLDEGIERLKCIKFSEGASQIIFEMICEILDELAQFDILKPESIPTYKFAPSNRETFMQELKQELFGFLDEE